MRNTYHTRVNVQHVTYSTFLSSNNLNQKKRHGLWDRRGRGGATDWVRVRARARVTGSCARWPFLSGSLFFFVLS